MSARGSIATIAIAAVLVLVLVSLAGIGGVAAADPSVDCAGSGGGALFVADSNFTVADNGSAVMYNQSTFPDDRTIRLRNVTLASNASTFLGLENATGNLTCVANVSATNDSIEIAPDGETNVSVAGNVSVLSLGDADYAGGSADLAYNASESWTLTLYGTGLGSGADVNAVATGGGSTLASNATGSNGTLTLTLPSGNESVDLREDAAGGGGGGGPVFIPAPPSGDEGGGSPDFTITAIGVDASEVAVGEQVTVEARVDNDGDADGGFAGNLTADGQQVASGTVSINENWHANLTLSATFDQPGTYQLAVDGEAAGSVTVTGEPDLAVTDASLGATSATADDAVTVTATVENRGTAEGDLTVPLSVGGEEVDARTVTVGPGDSTTVTFEHTVGEPGSTPVTVAGEEVGTVDVAQSGQDGGSGGGTPMALGGGVLAILAVCTVGGYYWYDPEAFEEMLNR